AGGIAGEDLARAFNEVLGDDARLESLRRGALEVSRDFDVATAAGRLSKLYTGLIEARSVGA
ncbi:MAG: glycosyl transferase family 1, partial [Actinomyces bowdenii]|nr:glycosyl transferase family 1 [Actinomyces bowdenii]